jgi:hypothetical protein
MINVGAKHIRFLEYLGEIKCHIPSIIYIYYIANWNTNYNIIDALIIANNTS